MKRQSTKNHLKTRPNKRHVIQQPSPPFMNDMSFGRSINLLSSNNPYDRSWVVLSLQESLVTSGRERESFMNPFPVDLAPPMMTDHLRPFTSVLLVGRPYVHGPPWVYVMRNEGTE